MRQHSGLGRKTSVEWAAHRTPTPNPKPTLARLALRQQAGADPADKIAEYHFLQDKLVDGPTLARAVAIAAEWRKPVHTTLVALGWLGEQDYARALARHLGFGIANGRALEPIAGREPLAEPTAVEAVDDGQKVMVVPALAFSPSDLDRAIGSAPASRRRVLLATSQEIDDLQLKPFRVQSIHTAVGGLARLDPEFSARRPVRRWQAALLMSALSTLVALLLAGTGETASALLLALSVPLACVAVLRLAGFWLLLTTAKRKGGQPTPASVPDRHLPPYTAMVALYREAEVVPQLIKCLQLIDYPPTHLEVLLVLEEVDLETRMAVAAADLPGNFKIVVVPPSAPRTKPKALNYALGLARGQFVVVYDAEDRPEPDQLKKALWKFAAGGPKLACVQARLNVYNPHQSFLTRQFAIEYTVLFDAILPALERLGLPMPLGGTSNHFVTERLRQAGAWDPFNVTEDADLGVRLARLGLRTGTIESTTWEESPAELANWGRQRTRWLKGWMQTWLVHTREPRRLWRELGPAAFLGFQVLMAGILVSVLLHPVAYVLVAIDWWNGRLLADASTSGELAARWIALANLGLGLVSTIGLGVFACLKRGWGRLAWSALAMPLYWLLISLAGYRSLWHLFVKPHIWEKTRHGRGVRAP